MYTHGMALSVLAALGPESSYSMLVQNSSQNQRDDMIGLEHYRWIITAIVDIENKDTNKYGIFDMETGKQEVPF